MADRRLQVCVLSDGRPGHYNQSRGVLEALRRVRELDAEWVGVDLRVGLVRELLRWRLNRDPPPATVGLLRRLCRLGDLPASCDLIVSAGGRSSFANAWLAAAWRVPNLYVGSLRGLSPRRFSLVLTLEPIAGAASNLVVPIPPSPVDERRVERSGAVLRTRLAIEQQRCWILLLGGPGAGYGYARDDWLALGRLASALAARHGIRWLLVSSRRTPQAGCELVRGQLSAQAVAAACWYADGDRYDAEAWLGAAQRVFVTEDSMTMITEAIYARRPLHCLRPARALPTRRYENALQGYVARGLLCRHRLHQLAARPDLLDVHPCVPLAASPTQWLAAELYRRLELE